MQASSAAHSRDGRNTGLEKRESTSAHADVDDEFAPPNTKEEALAFDSEHLLRTENIPFDVSVVLSC